MTSSPPSFGQALRDLNWTPEEWEQRMRESRARTWQNQDKARRKRYEQEQRRAGPFNGIRGIESVAVTLSFQWKVGTK